MLVHVLGHVYVSTNIVGCIYMLPISVLVRVGLKWGYIGRHTGRAWIGFDIQNHK